MYRARIFIAYRTSVADVIYKRGFLNQNKIHFDKVQLSSTIFFMFIISFQLVIVSQKEKKIRSYCMIFSIIYYAMLSMKTSLLRSVDLRL